MVGAVQGYKKMVQDERVRKWADKIMQLRECRRKNYLPIEGIRLVYKLLNGC